MPAPGRARLLVAPVLLLAVLAGLALPGAAGAAPARRVVLIGAAGLSWSAVTAGDAPLLAGLAAGSAPGGRRAAVGSVSVRSAQTPTCPVDGWSTVGAGQRAVGPARPGGRCPALPVVLPVATAAAAPISAAGMRPAVVAGFAALRSSNSRGSYGATPGLLGDTVAAEGACVGAVGPGAALAAATSTGRVAYWAPALAVVSAADLARCALTIVDAGTGTAAAEVALRAVLPLVDAGTTVIVAGIADGGAGSRAEPALGLLATATVDGAGGLLTSLSTRWPGFATLTDLTPTALAAAGLALPTGTGVLAGAPITVAPGHPPGLALLRAEAVRARVAGAQVGVWFTVAGLGGLLVLTVLALLLRAGGLRAGGLRAAGLRAGGLRPGGLRGGGLRAGGLRPGRVLAIGALALFCLPVVTRLASLVPWWQAGDDGRRAAALWAVQAGCALVLAVLATGLGVATRAALVPLAALAVLKVTVTVVDVATGSPLSRLAVIGLLPVDGSRFHGLGNEIVAATDTSLLLGSCLLVVPLVAHGRRVLAGWIVAGAGLGFAVVDGLPGLGDDLGGVPATIAGAGVAALLVAGDRLRLRRLAAVAVLAAAAGGALAIGDSLRAPGNRTHVGDFVVSLRQGHAGVVLARKAGSVVGPFAGRTGIPAAAGAWVGLLVVVGLAVVLLRPGATALDRLTPVWPTWRAALGGTAVAAVVGALLNDSGVIILLIAAGLSVMAVAAVLAPALATGGAAVRTQASEPPPPPASTSS